MVRDCRQDEAAAPRTVESSDDLSGNGPDVKLKNFEEIATTTVYYVHYIYIYIQTAWYSMI